MMIVFANQDSMMMAQRIVNRVTIPAKHVLVLPIISVQVAQQLRMIIDLKILISANAVMDIMMMNSRLAANLVIALVKRAQVH
jgi:hypothetical protein